MFFQLKEFLSWLGLTVFEVTTFAISFLVFTVLLTLKTELQFLDWKTADRSGHKCNLITQSTKSGCGTIGRQGFDHYWELFHYWGVHYSERCLYLK